MPRQPAGTEDTDLSAEIAKDARGQFARPRSPNTNSGVSSAAPRVLSGEEDATFDIAPGGKPLGTLEDKSRRGALPGKRRKAGES